MDVSNLFDCLSSKLINIFISDKFLVVNDTNFTNFNDNNIFNFVEKNVNVSVSMPLQHVTTSISKNNISVVLG